MGLSTRRNDPNKFNGLYTLWDSAKQQGNKQETNKQLRAIRNLGVSVLPILLAKIKEGNHDLVPIVSEITRSQIDPNASPAECARWWKANKEKWLIPFPNSTPIAKTGGDQIVAARQTVGLDGSGSMDPDGDEVSYEWSQISGPAVTLSDATVANPLFTAPSVNQQTILVFQLIAYDAGNLSKAVETPNSRSRPVLVQITVRP